MLAKVNTETYVDIDAITYIEGVEEDGELSLVQLMIGETPLTFNDPKVAQRILDAWKWHRQHSVYNMIEGTDNYKKKITP